MKTKLNAGRRSRTRGSRYCASAAVAVAALLFSAGRVSAQSQATTFAGNGAGYVDGCNQPAAGCAAPFARFRTPIGMANGTDPSGFAVLYIADRDNNAVRKDEIALTKTVTFATNHVSKPVGVAVDGGQNVFVLNRGTGLNGTVLKFNNYGNFLGTVVSGLPYANAIALDGATNIYVTVTNNKVLRIAAPPGGVFNVTNDYKTNFTGLVFTIATNTIAGYTNRSLTNVVLQGITIMDSGLMAVCDSGDNGILLINPATYPASGSISNFTGFNGRGDQFGTAAFAKFNQPFGIAEWSDGSFVVTDNGNHRIKTVDPSGSVCLLYGSCSNNWYSGSGGLPGWWDGAGCPCDTLCDICNLYAQARNPAGVVINSDGSVYVSEDYYHIIRSATSTHSGPAAPGSLPPSSVFGSPQGIAFNTEGTLLFIADQGGNAVRVLNPAATTNTIVTFLTAANNLANPVDVLLDVNDNVFVLNQGAGPGSGQILEFDRFGNLVTTNVTGLSSPTAFTVDGTGNFFVVEKGGAVKEIVGGVSITLANVTNVSAGAQLQGIALYNDGGLAVSDASNHVIWQIDAVTRAVTRLTGQIGQPGNTLGGPAFAKLNSPRHLALAADNNVVVADYGNDRLVVMDRSGAVTNVLSSTNFTSEIWYGPNNGPYGTNSTRFLPMRLPAGVAIGGSGSVFDSEDLYSDIRELLATGLSRPATLVTATNGTNVTVSLNPPPTISPNSGYFPMGQLIQVVSPYTNYYTTDGTEPTTSSFLVPMSGNVGFINWFGTLRDLTSLRVKSFLGGNASVTVSGQPVATNNVGVPPAPTPSGAIYAGVGSTIVVPVVMNLQSGATVQTYQFRLEVTNNASAIPITPDPSGLDFLDVTTNDFIPIATPTAAVTGTTGFVQVVNYTNGNAAGLKIFTRGNTANISFQHFAAVAMLKIHIPCFANVNDTYSISVLFPSATSNAQDGAVSLVTMPVATILVTNLSYLVGDTAGGAGTWYNAGGFGNSDLDNSDLNNAFYASVGIRVPFTFSDAFNAMDTYPPDAAGFVGGDGQIRFLDWTTILDRSLRLDTNSWRRGWDTGCNLTNSGPVALPRALLRTPQITAPAWPWYRQVLVGGVSVSGAVPGQTVNVPVYLKLADGSSLAGLQFRAVITAQNGAPAVTTTPQLTLAGGVPGASLQGSIHPGEAAFGWELGAFNYQSRSSNFLGWISFTVPANAASGQTYTLSFANADGSPDLNTQYDFESRSAYIAVNTTAAQASICSDEWKTYFFGSVDSPSASDMADPDGDGVPNWAEYLAGTDPTDPGSKLHFTGAQKQVAKGHSQIVASWLSAPGKAYEVQWASSPINGAWSALTNVSGSGGIISCTDTNTAASARYYRLHVLP